MDDVHGVLRAGEYALVVLEYERNAGGFEPAPGVFLREDMQEALHQAVAAGIDFGQGADPFEGVGQVAPASARDRDLGQGFRTGFIDNDMGVRKPAAQFGGAETAGGTGAYDGNFRQGT